MKVWALRSLWVIRLYLITDIHLAVNVSEYEPHPEPEVVEENVTESTQVDPPAVDGSTIGDMDGDNDTNIVHIGGPGVVDREPSITASRSDPSSRWAMTFSQAFLEVCYHHCKSLRIVANSASNRIFVNKFAPPQLTASRVLRPNTIVQEALRTQR